MQGLSQRWLHYFQGCPAPRSLPTLSTLPVSRFQLLFELVGLEQIISLSEGLPNCTPLYAYFSGGGCFSQVPALSRPAHPQGSSPQLQRSPMSQGERQGASNSSQSMSSMFYRRKIRRKRSPPRDPFRPYGNTKLLKLTHTLARSHLYAPTYIPS